jgi:hypothetical protein
VLGCAGEAHTIEAIVAVESTTRARLARAGEANQLDERRAQALFTWTRESVQRAPRARLAPPGKTRFNWPRGEFAGPREARCNWFRNQLARAREAGESIEGATRA